MLLFWDSARRLMAVRGWRIERFSAGVNLH
ncbi:hypothetical protein KPSA3_04330 [Pseudomonas syringae pv. actinidiae]|uniref:Uncharacterized protein n=1 Tax=Pseudomonas syringae pv. actinidiae TaxID=103796 RepID=A0AAN4Q7A8_PSESF|nr:hypothetical protein KPSA3_04330 [Pseudomonas syringae pv. actinidiae]